MTIFFANPPPLPFKYAADILSFSRSGREKDYECTL